MGSQSSVLQKWISLVMSALLVSIAFAQCVFAQSVETLEISPLTIDEDSLIGIPAESRDILWEEIQESSLQPTPATSFALPLNIKNLEIENFALTASESMPETSRTRGGITTYSRFNSQTNSETGLPEPVKPIPKSRNGLFSVAPVRPIAGGKLTFQLSPQMVSACNRNVCTIDFGDGTQDDIMRLAGNSVKSSYQSSYRTQISRSGEEYRFREEYETRYTPLSHVYAREGIYNVTLIRSLTEGNDLRTWTVNINEDFLPLDLSLKKGDIFLHGAEGGFSNLIPGPWSHAGLYIGNNQIIEAGSKGVHISNLSFWSYPDDQNVVVYRVKGLTDDQRQRVVDFAILQNGKKYDMRSLGEPLVSGKQVDCTGCPEPSTLKKVAVKTAKGVAVAAAGVVATVVVCGAVGWIPYVGQAACTAVGAAAVVAPIIAVKAASPSDCWPACNDYYCSELVWASYKKTLDIDLYTSGNIAEQYSKAYGGAKNTWSKRFARFIPNVVLPSHFSPGINKYTQFVGGHIEHVPNSWTKTGFNYNVLTFGTKCPVLFTVTTPGGIVLSPAGKTVPDIEFFMEDFDGDDSTDEMVMMGDPPAGTYRVDIAKRSDATQGDTFSFFMGTSDQDSYSYATVINEEPVSGIAKNWAKEQIADGKVPLLPEWLLEDGADEETNDGEDFSYEDLAYVNPFGPFILELSPVIDHIPDEEVSDAEPAALSTIEDDLLDDEEFDAELAALNKTAVADNTTRPHQTLYFTVAQYSLAKFVAENDRGDAPLIVTFEDLSPLNSNEWVWDFGDGTQQSGVPAVAHIYTQPGNYTAKLTVGNDKGFASASTRIVVEQQGIIKKAGPLNKKLTREELEEEEEFGIDEALEETELMWELQEAEIQAGELGEDEESGVDSLGDSGGDDSGGGDSGGGDSGGGDSGGGDSGGGGGDD